MKTKGEMILDICHRPLGLEEIENDNDPGWFSRYLKPQGTEILHEFNSTDICWEMSLANSTPCRFLTYKEDNFMI